MNRVTGDELLSELRAYCRRTGTKAVRVSRVAGMADTTFYNLARNAFPKLSTITALRRAMADHPEGIHDVVRPTPQVMRVTRSLGIEPARPSEEAIRRAALEDAGIRPTPAETLAGGLLREPSDLIATAKRQWPQLWARTLRVARDTGSMPGAMLMMAIERGLDAMEMEG